MSDIDYLQQQINALEDSVDSLSDVIRELSAPKRVEGLFSDEIHRLDLFNALSDWQGDTAYAEGTMVKHNGKMWKALPDVEPNSPPDDVYDLKANKGGWAPA